MREIEYRGKRIDNGEWVHATLFQVGELQNPFIMLKNRLGESYEVDPTTVGEFTGLRDSKRTEECPEGQKIYEGDVLQSITTRHYVVKWNTRRVQFEATSSQCGYIPEHVWCRSEIVGTIYENLELLEGMNGND